VDVPVVKPVIPKKAKPVEGELTTFPGTHVTVMPSGEVIVKKMERTKEDMELGLSDSDWEEYNSDEEVITCLYILSMKIEPFNSELSLSLRCTLSA
jgi:hypothetical protein